MPSSDSNFDPRLEAELRAVPLPEGLLARLRQTALADDEGLDVALREIPLPPGLLRRVYWAALADDDLDDAIRDAPLPAGLMPRLQQSIATADEEWIEAVGDMPVPAGAPERSRHTSASRSRYLRPTQWATAAALWIAVSVAMFGSLLALMLAVWPSARVPLPGLLPALDDFAGAPKGAEPEFSLLADTSDHGALQQDAPAGPPIPVPPLELAAGGRAQPAPWADPVNPFGRPRLGLGVDPLQDPPPYTWPPGILSGYGASEFDNLPELKKVPGPSPQGIKPPLVPGFPLDFYNRYGFHPFVSPAAHPRLRVSVVPLGVHTASYELARRYVEDGELPPPEKLRTEEFLAAIDYDYPDPGQRVLGLSAIAGPSPFGGEGLTLLQIGVQGRRFRDAKREPANLVLAVDVSASMQWGGRLDMIKRALARLIEQLRPGDRIALVTFHEEAGVLIEDAGPEDVYALRAAVASLAARGSTNLGAGLRRAYGVAQHAAAKGAATASVVLLTDGTAVPDQAAADLIAERLADAAAQRVRLEVIDLGQSAEPDPQLAGFARSGGGDARRAASADEVHWALREILSGKSQVIANDVRLEVSFNPKAVLEYRLLGHEASGIVGLMPDHPEADFHVGQSATALYEVRLRPGVMQEVATAELTWQPVEESGTPQRLSRTIGLKEFAYSFGQAAPSLQAAALAAQTAEVLRHHPRIPRGWRPLGRVIELAVQADPQLSQRPSYAEFMTLVQQADKVRSSRSGIRR